MKRISPVSYRISYKNRRKVFGGSRSYYRKVNRMKRVRRARGQCTSCGTTLKAKTQKNYYGKYRTPYCPKCESTQV